MPPTIKVLSCSLQLFSAPLSLAAPSCLRPIIVQPLSTKISFRLSPSIIEIIRSADYPFGGAGVPLQFHRLGWQRPHSSDVVESAIVADLGSQIAFVQPQLDARTKDCPPVRNNSHSVAIVEVQPSLATLAMGQRSANSVLDDPIVLRPRVPREVRV